MNTIIWELEFLSPPKTIRYCKKCGAKTEHVSSEAFRINAQQKALDVWLIYRCTYCKTTWNLTILSRVNPNSMDRELLERFTCNDRELARSYAMDAEFLNRNGAETEAPSYAVIGGEVDLTQETRVKIVSRYPLGIRVSKILREKLLLSKKNFDDMVQKGLIRMENGADINKCRVNTLQAVVIGGSFESGACSDSIRQE